MTEIMIRRLLIILTIIFIPLNILAQEQYANEYDVGKPLPTTIKLKIGHSWDRRYKTVITHIELPTVYIYPPMKFKNRRQRAKYTKLVRNVKKTLPIAKMINGTIIETYEYLQTLPDEKAKQDHLKAVEKGLKKQYTPQMKKLTYSQGKLLIKLVDRECNSRAYDLIKAFMGSFKAGVYNAFATIFGATLKKHYNPVEKEEDQMIERIAILVENGQL